MISQEISQHSIRSLTVQISQVSQKKSELKKNQIMFEGEKVRGILFKTWNYIFLSLLGRLYATETHPKGHTVSYNFFFIAYLILISMHAPSATELILPSINFSLQDKTQWAWSNYTHIIQRGQLKHTAQTASHGLSKHTIDLCEQISSDCIHYSKIYNCNIWIILYIAVI